MKFVKYLAWTIVLLFVLIPSILYGLVATNTGSVWLITQAVKFTDYELSYSDISGNLISELRINDAKINNSSLRLEAGYIALAWQPTALFDNKLILKKVVGEQVTIWLPASSNTESDDSPVILPELSLPIELQVQQLRTREVTLVFGQSDSQVKEQSLPDLDLQLTWFEQKLNIKRLLLSYKESEISAKGNIITAGLFPLQLSANWRVSNAISQADIGEIIGTANISGNSQALELISKFNLNNAPQEQRVSVRIQDLLSQPKWLAQADLTNFKIAPLLDLIFPPNSPWNSLLSQATVMAKLTLDQNQIVVERLSANLNDAQQGKLIASSTVTNYLDALTAPNKAQLNVALVAENIQLPNLMPSKVVSLNSLSFQANGDLSQFTHQIDLVGDFDDYKGLAISSIGSGSLEQVIIDDLTVMSESVNAKLSARIGWADGFAMEATITELLASIPELAAYSSEPVSARGQVVYNKQRITATDFQLSWNDTFVELDGSMHNDDPLIVSLAVPQLDALNLGSYVVGSAEGKFELTGALDKNISITLSELNIKHPDFGDWQNKGIGKVTVPVATPMAFSATGICIAANSRRNTAELCADTTSENSIQNTTITGTALPLSLINRFRNATVAERIWGLANLEAQLSYDASNFTLVSTQGRLYSERTILFALDEEVSTRFEYWEIDWNGNQRNVDAALIAELEHQKGTLLGEIAIEEPFKQAKLDGEILLDIQDLTILQWVLPDLRYENAQAVGAINISGTKLTPEIEGSVELAAQEVGFAQTGLVLSNVRIAAFDNSSSNDTITLNGQAESGDGWISIKGDIQPLMPALDIKIQGDKFRAVQLPTITVDVSPDIDIKLANKRIDITGKIEIPTAIIDQPEIEGTTTTPSSDVRIYENGERVESDPTSIYPLFANVRVTLGENVKVTAFGFDGQLSGNIRVDEAPNRALTATGSIQVKKGFYELYGQRLEIDRGSLIYSGGPISNPGLDLRVSRAKENMMTTENITVGAQVSGTMQEPDFRLYSTPAMPDSEILSYLILGRGSGNTTGGNENLQLQALILLGSKGTDILGESLQETFGFDEFGIDSTMNPNDTSFYIGKYLSPKLYVKYGVGLFENTNTFLIRYLLSEHFIIESTASGEAQGGDIFYTIEK
ncbi:translocation/assembly module TamB domain-containing protein [Pseudidiomarina woesei]|uniref:Autotransporter translocation and assembly factor TamB n=1 Tax=Pseudidiomarina woesei TaxID=1381080 RepID=A0A0K6HC28_9GAMM|nr:translocation/assembly module TamB domain-containing protein [Pseudidiomarina woesei]CUA88316.1 Autotransporter translocation and assembly factor TamB [Pseudidiomarina woesei]